MSLLAVVQAVEDAEQRDSEACTYEEFLKDEDLDQKTPVLVRVVHEQELVEPQCKTITTVTEAEIALPYEAKVDCERQPLLGNKQAALSSSKHQTSNTKAFFLLFNSFIGPGILFVPKAFLNGGLLFSSVTFAAVAIITFFAMRLLLRCGARFEGSFGEIGRTIAGRKVEECIQLSIVLAQLGCVCTAAVFVADAISGFMTAVTHPATPLSQRVFIILQLGSLIPLSLIRNISKLSFVSTMGNLFVFISVVYICYCAITSITLNGVGPSISLSIASNYSLTIGSSIFIFQSISLLIPIRDSMVQPQNFESILIAVLVTLTIILEFIGVLSYMAWGSLTSSIVMNNLPQTSILTSTVQLLYGAAVLFGAPVQLFPVLRIIADKVFGSRSGRTSLRTKWEKNMVRAAVAVSVVVISVIGSNNLDQFVALIGTVTCLPLMYIFPALLHYMGVATSRGEKLCDILFMIVGFGAMFYTTYMTIGAREIQETQ